MYREQYNVLFEEWTIFGPSENASISPEVDEMIIGH
jgi:hypothetical protein